MIRVLKDYNPPPMELKILYEDERLLALSKPSGLLSVPGIGADRADCLAKRIAEKYPEALVIHRLDMDTSGVFLMARDKKAQGNIGKQFEQRRVSKTYIADIWGVPEESSGLIDLPLRCDWENRPLHMVCHEHGKPAQTKWELLEVRTLASLREAQRRSNPEPQTGLPRRADGPPRNDDEMKIARLKLEPITGRTHQLRVHLKAIGFPIVGDAFYAPDDAYEASTRMHLHAHTLTFHHPDTGHKMTITDEVGF